MTTATAEATRPAPVPYGARGFTRVSTASPFPAGTALCPERQVNIVPDGTPLVETGIITMGSGCWEATGPDGGQDFHGDD